MPIDNELKKMIKELDEAHDVLERLILSTEAKEADLNAKLSKYNLDAEELKEKSNQLKARETAVAKYGILESGLTNLSKKQAEIEAESLRLKDATALVVAREKELASKIKEVDEITEIYKINMKNVAGERAKLEEDRKNLKKQIIEQISKA